MKDKNEHFKEIKDVSINTITKFIIIPQVNIMCMSHVSHVTGTQCDTLTKPAGHNDRNKDIYLNLQVLKSER